MSPFRHLALPPRRPGPRLGAPLGALLVGVAAWSSPPGVARADARTLGVERQAWYWESGRKTQVPNTGVQLSTPNPAAPGHLLVGTTPSGQPDKRAYLAWPLDGLEGATVTKFTVTLEVSRPDATHVREHQTAGWPPPQTLNDAQARITACPTTSFLVEAEGAPTNVSTVDQAGQPSQVRQEPTFDCALGKADLTRSADGSRWSVDIAGIANLWTQGRLENNGIVLRPADGATGSWTVEFHGRERVLAEVEFVPAPRAPEPPPAPRPPEETLLPAPVIPPTQVFSLAESAPAAAGTGAGAPAVRVPARSGGGGGALPAASTGELQWYVWLLLPAGLAGVWALSRALVPQWAEEPRVGENRIAATLRARRLSQEGAG